jgi:hypothetical protein
MKIEPSPHNSTSTTYGLHDSSPIEEIVEHTILYSIYCGTSYRLNSLLLRRFILTLLQTVDLVHLSPNTSHISTFNNSIHTHTYDTFSAAQAETMKKLLIDGCPSPSLSVIS